MLNRNLILNIKTYWNRVSIVKKILQFGNCNKGEVTKSLKVDKANPSLSYYQQMKLVESLNEDKNMTQDQIYMMRMLLIQNHQW